MLPIARPATQARAIGRAPGAPQLQDRSPMAREGGEPWRGPYGGSPASALLHLVLQIFAAKLTLPNIRQRWFIVKSH